jgi:hypothetical protein
MPEKNQAAMGKRAYVMNAFVGLGLSNSSQPELKRLNAQAQTVYGHKAHVAAYYLVCLHSAIHVSSISGLVLFGKILYTLQQWAFYPPD